MIPDTFYNDIFEGYVPNINIKEEDRGLSEATALAAALCMKYVRGMEDETLPPRIFILSLPGKAHCAPWIASLLTLNILKAELPEKANRRIKDLGLKGGELVDVFGATCKFVGISRKTGKIKLRLAKQLTTHANPETVNYINTTNKKRLTLPKTYSRKKEEFKELKPFARLLELETNPNRSALTSKVFVCAGHGQTKGFKSALEETEIMDETAGSIVGLDENLLVKSRLNAILKAVKPEAAAGEGLKALKIKLDRMRFASDPLQEEADELLKLIDQPDEGEELYRRFREFCEAVKEDPEDAGLSEKLEKLRKKIPEPRPNIISDLKAVVLNDASLLEDYPETIAHLLENRTPVILLADHSAEDYEELKLAARLSSKPVFGDAYRFGWNKSKLAALFQSASASLRYMIDRQGRNLQKRFAEQRVEIIVRDNTALGRAYRLLESRELSAYLRSEEDARQLFFRCIRPLLYLVKNAFSLAPRRAELEAQISQAKAALDAFKKELRQAAFEQIYQGLDMLEEALEADEFGAPFPASGAVFYQEIAIEGAAFAAPDSPELPLVNAEQMQGLESLVFAGLPYQEYKRAALWRAVFGEIIPDIKIFALPEEAGRIQRYLSGRFEAAQFPDALPADWALPEVLVQKQEEKAAAQFLQIVRSSRAAGDETPEDDIAAVEHEFNQAKYSGFLEGKGDKDAETRDYLVACNVVHFVDDSFLFLPKGDKVLSVFPYEEEWDCGYREFQKLKPGQDIVVYWISKETLVAIVEGSDNLSADLDRLYEWRDVLEDAYDEHKHDVHVLCGRLKRIAKARGLNSSINELNVKRWLFDDYLLSPENDNLLNILYLKYSPDSEKESKAALERISVSKKEVMDARRTVRQKADKEILGKLRRSARLSDEAEAFRIAIDNVEVDCRRARIAQLEPCKDLQVPYYNTYKIYD